MTSESTLSKLGRSLDERINAMFAGNTSCGEPALIDHRSDVVDVNLRMQVELEWEYAWNRSAGGQPPNNSIRCANAEDAKKRMREIMNTQIASSDETHSLASRWRNDLTLLTKKTEKIEIRKVSQSWHTIEDCRACSGQGDTMCNCMFGKQFCPGCGGSGHHEVMESNGRQTYTVSRRCVRCYGVGRVNCIHCGGTHRQACNNCGRHGYFQTVYTPTITANISRNIRTIATSDQLTFETIKSGGAAMVASLGRSSEIWTEIDATTIRFEHCVEIAYTHNRYRVADREYDVAALGENLSTPTMPPMLNPLAKATLKAIKDAPNAAMAFRAAAQSRLTSEIAKEIGSTPSFDAEALNGKFHNGASVVTVQAIGKALEETYQRCSDAQVRHVWLRDTVVACIVLGILYSLGLVSTVAAWLSATDTIAAYIAVTLFLITLSVCGISARARHVALSTVQNALGAVACRVPSQGRRPYAYGATILVCGVLLAHLNAPPPQKTATFQNFLSADSQPIKPIVKVGNTAR